MNIVKSIWSSDALQYIGSTTVDKVVSSHNIRRRTNAKHKDNQQITITQNTTTVKKYTFVDPQITFTQKIVKEDRSEKTMENVFNHKPVANLVAQSMVDHLISSHKQGKPLDKDIFQTVVAFNETSSSIHEATKQPLCQLKQEIKHKVDDKFFAKEATLLKKVYHTMIKDVKYVFSIMRPIIIKLAEIAFYMIVGIANRAGFNYMLCNFPFLLYLLLATQIIGDIIIVISIIIR